MYIPLAIVVLFLLTIVFAAMTGQTSTALAISVIGNLVLLLYMRGNNPANMTAAHITHAPSASSASLAPAAEASLQVQPDPVIPGNLGPYYDNWHTYQQSYDIKPRPRPLAGVNCADRANTIDSATELMVRRRTRDLAAMNGQLCKDKNYYAYHFGSELADHEAARWWGAREY